MNICYSFNVNLSFFIYPSLKNRAFFFLAFCCTCEKILPEPRVGILFVFSIRGHGLTHDPPACVVLLDSQMLFIWFGVKKKKRVT